ncbi:hypothetical protein BGZ72_001936, partial [Mortierella alpina]
MLNTDSLVDTLKFEQLTFEPQYPDSLNALGEMFDTHLWPRSALSLREIIEVAGIFLKFTQSTNNPNALTLLCGNISTALSAMKRGARKALDPSSFADDRELCESIASIYTEQGKLWERLESDEKAKHSFEKAEKW